MQVEVKMILQKADEARRQGQLETARRAFEQALETSSLSQDEHGRLAALKGLGQLERDAGNPDQALYYFDDATRLARRTATKRLVAHTIRHYADAYRAAGQLAQALPLYQEALALYGEDPATPGLELANALRPAAIVFEQLSHNQRAVKYWQQARTLYESAGIEAGVLECDEGISRCKRT